MRDHSRLTLNPSLLILRGGLEVKNHKMFINLVSTITFFSFPMCSKFWYQIVDCCVFSNDTLNVFIDSFLEDTCSNIKVTQKGEFHHWEHSYTLWCKLRALIWSVVV